MFILNKHNVDNEEELIRQRISSLSNNDKKSYYEKIENKIKDPDNYAVLNWFFLSGLHHFYLGRNIKGFINLSISLISIILFSFSVINILIFFILILIIFLIEIPQLFRSQIIVQNYNNNVMDEELKIFEKDKKITE